MYHKTKGPSHIILDNITYVIFDLQIATARFGLHYYKKKLIKTQTKQYNTNKTKPSLKLKIKN